MAGPASESRQFASELALAALGAVALTAERIDDLAEMIAARGGLATSEEARAFLREQVERWREEAARVSGRAASWLGAVGRELGLVSRDEADELELRIAQLEHRLHLLERDSTAS
jgi:polyhydroxyalkanoate synthesis regulator phasin